MTRPTLEQLKKEALANEAVRAEYEALSSAFNIKRQMIALRRQAGLTQQQMAERLGTRKSNISRLESLESPHSPRLETLEAYARELGYSVQVQLVPQATAKPAAAAR